MGRSMELETWSGDWGLPSIDISCLQIMVFSKFSGVPLVVKQLNNPFRRVLPTFNHGDVKFHNLQDVAMYLQSKNFNFDNFLSPKSISEIQAYDQLLKDKLYPALQFIWWIDEKNYVKLTRPWYAKKLPFPFNYYYPGNYQDQAKDLVSSLYGSLEEEYGAVENLVYSDAEKCLTLLSNKLGDSKYFFGNQPSSLDAIVFSYLAPLLKAPFPNPALQNHLKACTNLVNFVESILEKYFSTLQREYAKKKRELQQAKENENFPYKSRYQFLAVFIAFAAMCGYITIAPSFIRVINCLIVIHIINGYGLHMSKGLELELRSRDIRDFCINDIIIEKFFHEAEEEGD